MTEPAFLRASSIERIEEGRYRVVVPDGWQQGRGAFGGLVLGTMLRAVESAEGEPARRARSLSGDICGPVLPGDATIETRLLRRGNNQSNWQAALVQNGETLAIASVVLSSPRAVTTPSIATPPPATRMPYGDVPVIALAPIGPPFAQHFEYRPHGAMPFTGGAEPVVTGWIRERETLAAVDAPAITARLDAYYPALFAMTTMPRPCATISFVAQYLVDPKTLDPAAPLYYVARDAAIADGFFVELRELWHEQTLVALNQQTFAVLK